MAQSWMAPDLKKIFLNIFIKIEKKKLCKKDKNLFSELQNKGLSLRIVISQHISALMSNQKSNAMKQLPIQWPDLLFFLNDNQ